MTMIASPPAAAVPGPIPTATTTATATTGLDLGRLRDSRLLAGGGVAVIDLLDDRLLANLAGEARQAYRDRAEQRTPLPPVDDWDRGNPDRWLESAVGGPVLAALLSSRRLHSILEDHTGIGWSSLSSQGTFSYYCRPGHHLGVHRDIRSCDLTCIVCCELSGEGSGGELLAYRSAVRAPLSQVRARSFDAVGISLRPGQAALLLGGLVPHRVTAVAGGLRRTVAPLCFTPRRR